MLQVNCTRRRPQKAAVNFSACGLPACVWAQKSSRPVVGGVQQEFEFHSRLVQYSGPLPALLLAMMNSLELDCAESADWKDGHRGSPREDSRRALWTERCRAAAIGNGDDGDLALGLLGRDWPRAERGESARGGA
jgi:hypothetical protein